MSINRPFEASSIEPLAKLLAECGSGSDISRVLNERGIRDGSGESTKWKRLDWIFQDVQRRTPSYPVGLSAHSYLLHLTPESIKHNPS